MDEIFSLSGNLPEELIRNGLSSQLNVFLNALKYLTGHNQERFKLLIIAPSDEIIRVFLFQSDAADKIELKGQIIIERINGAISLYLTVPNALLQLSKDNSLPIHQRLDIVRSLIGSKYSPESNECARALFRGPAPLIEYLMRVGANLNYSFEGVNHQYQTPLALTPRIGHEESMGLLWNNNAENFSLRTAVRSNQIFVIRLLLEQSINTIEDFELAVCSLIEVDSFVEQMNEALELLKFALHYRQLKLQPKVSIPPIAAYNFEQECQTIKELNSIKNDRNRILIEIFLIRERIFLSCEDITIIKSLHDYGDMLVSEGNFEQCLNVWIHMFYLYQQMGMGTILHRFVWLFCKMLTRTQVIPVERFLQVCQLVFEESHITEKNYAIWNALFFVIIAARILEQKTITRKEKIDICRWVNDLCRHGLTTTDERTLLHLCVDQQSNRMLSFRPLDTRQYLRFPNESGLRLLLTCGSRWLDLDAIEPFHGNTPLHIICYRTQDRKIIELLLNAGCHIDCVNKHGKSPIDYVKNKQTRTLLSTKSAPLNLKCLCARMIVKKRLNINTFGTSALNKFIILHGGSFIQHDNNWNENLSRFWDDDQRISTCFLPEHLLFNLTREIFFF